MVTPNEMKYRDWYNYESNVRFALEAPPLEPEFTPGFDRAVEHYWDVVRGSGH